MNQLIYQARLDARNHAPRIIHFDDSQVVLTFVSLAHAVASVTEDKASMVPHAAEAWGEHMGNCKQRKDWGGGACTPQLWREVLLCPPAILKERITTAYNALETIPTPFRDLPRRKAVRGLDEGDTLDAITLIEDHGDGRAWSESRGVPRKRPCLRVCLNVGLNCNLDAEAMAWRGACAMAIARKAEDAGADVELLAAFAIQGTAVENDTMLCVAWPLKAQGQHADRDLLTAYTCHLSAFRYFAWALLAQHVVGDRVAGGWGCAGDLSGSLRKHLAADIVVDYNVTTKQRAMDCMTTAAKVIESSMVGIA